MPPPQASPASEETAKDQANLPSPGLQLPQQNRSSYFAPTQTTRPSYSSSTRNMQPTRRAKCPSNHARRHMYSERPVHEIARPETQYEWVDDGYLDKNPWYGQAKQKPVFSLGKPFPHTSRPRREARKGRPKRDVEAAEDKRGPGEDDGQETRRPSTASRGGESDPAPHLFHDASRFAIDAEPIGHREEEAVEEGRRDPNEMRNWWAKLRANHPEVAAEFLATLTSIFLGIAGSLNVLLLSDSSSIYGTFEISWSWGFAWMLGIYVGGGVSGAHMNPTISFTLSVYRRFPWRQCITYTLVQLLAGLIAGALAFGAFRDTIYQVDPGLETKWNAFCSMPRDGVGIGNAVLAQIIQSATMIVVVLALGDDQNNPPGAGMHAFILGLLLTTLRLALGSNTGSALNPAADLGPRLVTIGVGYDKAEVFGDVWWVVGPWAANMAGALIGGALYDGCIFVGSESPINRRLDNMTWTRIIQKG